MSFWELIQQLDPKWRPRINRVVRMLLAECMMSYLSAYSSMQVKSCGNGFLLCAALSSLVFAFVVSMMVVSA